MEELSSRRNVHFLGPKSVEELPAYPQHFDVCTMPYRDKIHSVKYGYPLKLHEYLASGRPVVGSPLDSLFEFTDVVRLARTPEEWSRALHESLCKDAMESVQVEARRSIARKYDWDHLVKFIARTLCERLGPTYLKQFQGLPGVSLPGTAIQQPTVSIQPSNGFT